MRLAVNWNRSNFCWGTHPFRRLNATSGASKILVAPSTIGFPLRPRSPEAAGHPVAIAREFPNNYRYERRKGIAGRNNTGLARLSGSSRTNHKSKVLKLCFGYRQDNAVEGNDGAFGTFHLSVARTRGL